MDISIVTGTYNRKDSLIQMVSSVRRSLGFVYGISYELVIVDGGSNDGTLEWCKNQLDIVLIEQGKLLGAVKAFNEGAYAAKGQYVILANDDIVFVDTSIWESFVFMQKNPFCGMGCFEQDRDNRGWHVNEMPAVIDGQQSSILYGQVCIVPKWLGDMVGWWGDYLHTYGGDNELTANIYELGFEVKRMEGVRIHDKTIEDDLRKINNISGGKDPRAKAGHHPDSYDWGKRWEHPVTRLTGPVIGKERILVDRTEVTPRVLYLPIYEHGMSIQKEQKHGLRDALSERAIVFEYDYVKRFTENKPQALEELASMIKLIQPTIILSQLHNAGTISVDMVKYLKELSPFAFWVNWNGDYWPENLTTPEGLELAKLFDLQTVINRDVLKTYAEQKINARYWQIAWEPEGIGHTPVNGESYDVVFLANGYAQERRDLGKYLSTLANIKLGLFGSGWPGGQENTTYNFVRGCQILSASKIAIGDTPDNGKSGFVSNRLFQTMCVGGAAFLQQHFQDMELLGLEDGKNIATWQSYDDLIDKIDYYLSHEDERKEIAKNAQELMLARHSFEHRVSELFGMIDLSMGGWRC